MKKLTIICLLGLLTSFLFGNTNSETSFKVYLGSGITQLDNEAVISLDATLSYPLYQWMNVGISGSAFHTLEREYKDTQDKAYQAESGFSEIFMHPHWNVNEKWDLGVRLGVGMQLVQFRYEEKLREDLVWTEEYLDKLELPMQTLAMTAEYTLCPAHSLSLDLGYRNINETKTPFAEDSTLTGAFFGKIQYGFSF